jgi:diguanylate cyclase (GGDEF)-like protein
MERPPDDRPARPPRTEGPSTRPTLPDIGVRTSRAAAETPADLIVIAHPEERHLGARFRLEAGGSLTIGRAENADVSFPDAPSVSRHHAQIRHGGETILIEDLGSRNGTWINDAPIRGPQVLKSGDRFQVGSVHFKLLHEFDVEAAYHKAVYEFMTHDALTGAWNRRSLESELSREWSRALRYGRPFSLILFDLDQLKKINDTHGHLAGDVTLKRTAELVRSVLRTEQVFARVGGDEFAILCPETPLESAAALAERLRAAVEQAEPLPDEPDQKDAHTCSFGVAQFDGTGDWLGLYGQADDALYQSKHAGGNRVSLGLRPGATPA